MRVEFDGLIPIILSRDVDNSEGDLGRHGASLCQSCNRISMFFVRWYEQLAKINYQSLSLMLKDNSLGMLITIRNGFSYDRMEIHVFSILILGIKKTVFEYIISPLFLFISTMIPKCHTVFEIKGAPCTRCAHFDGRVHRF